MSYNGSGTFQINTTGQPVVAGTVISSTAFNALTADLATGLSTAITKDGQTATTARIPFAAGITSTLVTDSSSTSTGSIITAGGVGVAKALYVGTTANIAGVLSTTSPNITTSITTPSASFDLINATATTLNLGGAATAVNVGAATGTMTVANTTLAAKAITASTTLGVTGAATLSSTLTYGGVTLTNAVTGTGKMVLDTSPTLVTPALGTPASGILTSCTGVNYDGFKNRIINGAMVIDQRNAGAAITGTTSLLYSVDRFTTLVVTDGVMTFQQVSDAPTGFKYSLKATATTADASLSAAQRAILLQRIEGYNVIDLMLGSANAIQFTASFWVKSTLTGTFGGAFQNNSSARAYPFTYTISVANTWEQKTVTITGDTTGTWDTTTGTGLQIVWGLGVGSTYSGTAGAWATGDFNSATGATSVIGTLNATWQVTGVQLEKGSTATSFDYRPYGTELALCQRYFETTYPIGTAVGTASTDASAPVAFSMGDSGVVTQQIIWMYKVKKCSAPTVTVYNPNSGASGSARYAGTTNINFSAQGSRVDQATFGSGSAGMAINSTFSYYMTANSEL